MSNNQFSALDNVKMTCKHISTKVSFKITKRKKHVYIDIVWPWLWNQCFYLGIWNDDRIKMIVFPSFHLATRLNSQNTNETEFINEIWPITLFMNIGISIWHNRSFDLTKMFFFYLFQFLTRLMTSNHLKLFSTYLVGWNWTMWKTCLSAPQKTKKGN